MLDALLKTKLAGCKTPIKSHFSWTMKDAARENLQTPYRTESSTDQYCCLSSQKEQSRQFPPVVGYDDDGHVNLGHIKFDLDMDEPVDSNSSVEDRKEWFLQRYQVAHNLYHHKHFLLTDVHQSVSLEKGHDC